MLKNAFDDGLRPELLQKTFYDGIFEIPRLEPPTKILEPTALIPFSQRNKDLSRMVHFYEHEKHYQKFTNRPEYFLEDLRKYPGIITPDNSILVDAPLIAQLSNIFITRRNASFLQHEGLYTIPNVRWGDERTFTTIELPEPVAFIGIPHDSIVAIGTYGCCKTKDEKRLMHLGVIEMLKFLAPKIVIVYGSMPSDVFCDLPGNVRFLHFDNWTKETHN